MQGFMSHDVKNLLADLPTALPQELVDVLHSTDDVRIERVVSTGHSSPAGFWYDQPEDEWVLLLAGETQLQFKSEDQPRQLRAGDCLLIPAHVEHRVAWTTPAAATVWLAVFLKSPQNAS